MLNRNNNLKTTKSSLFELGRLQELLWVVTGVTVTTPIVEVQILGRFLPINNCLLFFAAILSIRDMRIKEARFGLVFVWLLTLLISEMMGMLYFDGMAQWISITRSMISKISLLLGIYFVIACLANGRDGYSPINQLVRGLIIGCYFNCIWCILDAAGYYLLGKSLTNSLFAGYIQRHSIRYGQLSLIRDGVIRSGALTGDPANGGYYASFLAIYSILGKKGRVADYLISLGAVAASVSVSGIAAVIVGSIIALALNNNRNRKIPVAVLFGLLIIPSLFAIPQLHDVINPLVGRVAQKLIQGDSLRAEYYSSTMPLLFSRKPGYLLFGTGVGTTSFDFLNSNTFINLHEEYRPYDPESVYVTYLFGSGLVGSLIYCSALILGVEKHHRLSSDSSRAIVSALLACGIIGFFYHYTLYLPMMLFMICSDQLRAQVKTRENSYRNENHE